MPQNINLYEAPRQGDQPLVSLQGVVVVTALLLAGLGTLHWLNVQRSAHLADELSQLRATHERMSRQVAQLPGQGTATERLLLEERDVAALEQIAGRLSAGALGRAGTFTDHLRALARGTADGVWLTGIRIDNTSSTLVLEGRAVDPARVPQLFNALRNEPLFEGLAFGALELKAVTDSGSPNMGQSAAQSTGQSGTEVGQAARRGSQLVRFRIRTPEAATTVATAAPPAPAAPSAAPSAALGAGTATTAAGAPR